MADETKAVNSENLAYKTHLYAGRKKEAFVENGICVIVLSVEKQVDVNLSRSKFSLLWGRSFLLRLIRAVYCLGTLQ